MTTPLENARELCHQADIEVLKCRRALALAESVCADRHLELGELLAQRDSATLKAEQHNAYPKGRWTSAAAACLLPLLLCGCIDLSPRQEERAARQRWWAEYSRTNNTTLPLTQGR